jgi:hypothetical protein
MKQINSFRIKQLISLKKGAPHLSTSKLLFGAFFFAILSSCVELTETPQSLISEDNYYKTLFITH